MALLEPSAAVLTVLGIVALAGAITQAKRYWLMNGLYTFARVFHVAG